MDKYFVLEENELKVLEAFETIADNAFCGYAEGFGREEENELGTYFAWMVSMYIKMLKAYSPVIEDTDNRLCKIVSEARAKWIEEKEMKQHITPLND